MFSRHGLTRFTARPILVLAPEHPFVEQLTTPDRREAIRRYRRRRRLSPIWNCTDLAKEKTGEFTGSYAINPVNEEEIPVWIADYVLMGYGTGAIMAVPAHDTRDWEFANNYKDQGLDIVHVVARDVDSPEYARGRIQEALARKEDPASVYLSDDREVFVTRAAPFVGEGIAINSGIIDGLATPEAKKKITKWLEQHGVGKAAINYKLRDWLFSRQRYWGEPFPIIWKNGKHEALAENELPIVPPSLEDYKPTGTGEPPLARAKEWVRYSEKVMRETNTMPQWAGSCWYYLRFCDPQNDKRFVGKEAERYWSFGSEVLDLPEHLGGSEFFNHAKILFINEPEKFKLGTVDLYVGGTEHAVLHLLYARFWQKVLFDLGYVSKPEPFQRLVNQGIILGEDNQKMSKSRGNIVSPDDVIDQYGADAFRCYEMFMGPLEQMKPWSMRGVEGVSRFLARVWRLFMRENQSGDWELSGKIKKIDGDKAQQKVTHATIRKVTEDIESFSFNTAISQMMIFVNAFTGAETLPLSSMRSLLVLLSPFAPHMASELWERLNASFTDARGDITRQRWPSYDEQLLVEDEVEVVLQINGKVRDRMKMSIVATDEQMKTAALSSPKIHERVAGKTVRNVIVVPKKLVNIVVD